jgi:hypothetical protein
MEVLERAFAEPNEYNRFAINSRNGRLPRRLRDDLDIAAEQHQ